MTITDMAVFSLQLLGSPFFGITYIGHIAYYPPAEHTYISI